MKTTVQKNFEESEASLTIKFDGEKEIDAQTLAVSLKNIIEIIQEITSQEPDSHAKLMVRSIKQNSFQIDFGAVVSFVPTLFTKSNLEYAKAVVDTFLISVKLKQFLKGKKPQKITSDGIVINHNGDSQSFGTTTNLYFNNCNMDNSFNNMFGALAQDPNRTGLVMKSASSQGEQVSISKEEYPVLALPVVGQNNDVAITTQTNENEGVTSLIVKKIDLIGDSKWEFVSNKAIKAKILDQVWLDNFRRRSIIVLPGDKLLVKMKSKITCDDELNVLDEKYDILEVMEVVSPSDNDLLSIK